MRRRLISTSRQEAVSNRQEIRRLLSTSRQWAVSNRQEIQMMKKIFANKKIHKIPAGEFKEGNLYLESILKPKLNSMANISFRDLTVFKKAFELAMDIFELTKKFPADEKFSLTSQIRRSSRSVCSNVSEAYRKRIYRGHFISKISDADMENSETQVWLDFSLKCE